MRVDAFVTRDVGEGRVACQEVVKRAAEAIDVGPAVYVVRAVSLFGGR